jgi:predicted metal-dependent phosphoesterase TrpH
VTARFRESRIGRAKKIVSILNGLGLTSLTYERIKEIAGDASIGRPHIAKALLEAGYIQSIQEAFDRYLADDGPADVGRDKFEPIPAIELVHRAGGIAIAAHPLEGKRIDPLIPELAAAGLDGMEVYYYGYDAEKTRFLAELADANGLAHSGGTDFHGFPMNGEAEIGNWPGTLAVPAFVLPRLRERAEKRRSRVALAALART